jgi:hypothetical protein
MNNQQTQNNIPASLMVTHGTSRNHLLMKQAGLLTERSLLFHMRTIRQIFGKPKPYQLLEAADRVSPRPEIITWLSHNIAISR